MIALHGSFYWAWHTEKRDSISWNWSSIFEDETNMEIIGTVTVNTMDAAGIPGTVLDCGTHSETTPKSTGMQKGGVYH
jgi:hypothetical protein